MSVCALVTLMYCAKTAELIQSPDADWGLTYVGQSNHVLDGVQIFQGEENSGGCPDLSSPLKSSGSHCGVSSKNLISASEGLLQPTALLPTGRCLSNFSPVKNLPSAMRPVVKIIWPFVHDVVGCVSPHNNGSMKTPFWIVKY